MKELIWKQDAIDALCRGEGCGNICRRALENLPTVQVEPLTDYEQRLFLSAMEKEKKVCEKLTNEWDERSLGVPCPVNLLQLCVEIERKVKAALWMN